MNAIKMEMPKSKPKTKSKVVKPRVGPTEEVIEEMLEEYILDRPIPEEEQRLLQRPLRPVSRAPATRGLYLRITQQEVRGFLVGYEMHVPNGHSLDGDPTGFLNHVKSKMQRKLQKEGGKKILIHHTKEKLSSVNQFVHIRTHTICQKVVFNQRHLKRHRNSHI